MNLNFYNDKDFRYPERAILMEDVTKDNPTGKFIIPVLTPVCNLTKVTHVFHHKYSTTNIISKANINVTEFEEQNYIELKIPEYIFSGNNSFEQGTEFIVLFIGGSPDCAKIVGVY